MTVHNLNAEKQRTKFEAWLADGESWIGVFENNDLSSPYVGERVAMVFDTELYDDAEMGQRAPDLPGLIGWRYGLVAKCTTAKDAVAEMQKEHDGRS